MLSVSEACSVLEIQNATGVPSTATIKNAFKRMALMHHPDKNNSPDAEEKFKVILKAYETLMNATDRPVHGNDKVFSKVAKWFGTTNFASYSDEPFQEKSFDDMLFEIFARNNTNDGDKSHSEKTDENALAQSRAGFWEEEEAKSDEERRKTYFCGLDYLKVEDVEDWPTYVTTHSINILKNDEVRLSCDEEIAKKVAVVHGSVAHFEADAILSSVNELLLRGGGVDHYVRRGAGEKIEWELLQFGEVSPGQCVITKGYNLPAKHVIHACGPCRNKPKQLILCYKNALDLAAQHKIKSIGMCCLSSGNNGYPLNDSTRIALKTIRKWLEVHKNEHTIEKIVFVCYRKYEVQEYEKWMQKYFPTKQLCLDDNRPNLENKN